MAAVADGRYGLKGLRERAETVGGTLVVDRTRSGDVGFNPLFPSVQEASVTVRHAKAGASGPIRGPRLNYAFHYGMLRFYRRHYAAGNGRLLNAAVYSGIAAKLSSTTQ